MKILFSALILFGFSFANLLSQIPGGQQVFTLDDCMDIALKRNAEIRISKMRVSASSSELTGAFGQFLPTVNFNAGYSRQFGSNYVYVDGQIIPIPEQNIKPNSYNMNAQAQIPIFNGFAREANYNSAKNNLDAEAKQMEHTAKLVKINVFNQYVDIIKKKQILKIRKEDFQAGQDQLEQIKASYEAGMIPIADVYAQEADLGSRELQIVTAENDINLAKADLLTTMGMAPDFSYEFLESSIPSDIEKNEIERFKQKWGSVKKAVQTALESRNDYAASDNSVESAESGITAARSGYMPAISAYGGWSWTNYEFSNISELGRSYIGLNLRITVFDNFNTNVNIQNAELNLTMRKIEKENLEFSIRTAVQSALLSLEAAEKQLEISERALKSAGQNYEALKERYNLGASTLLELNEANRQLLTAQINRVNYVYAYLKAQKQLLYEMGKI